MLRDIDVVDEETGKHVTTLTAGTPECLAEIEKILRESGETDFTLKAPV